MENSVKNQKEKSKPVYNDHGNAKITNHNLQKPRYERGLKFN